MYVASEILGTIADILLLIIFLNSFFFFRENRKWIAIFAFSLDGILFSALSFFPSFANLRISFTVFAVILLCFTLFECSLIQSIFSSFIYSTIYMLVDLITAGLLSLLHISVSQMIHDASAHTLSIVIARLIFLLLLMLLKIFSKKQSDTLSFKWILPLLPGQLLSISCCLFLLRDLLNTNSRFSVLQGIFLATLFYLNIVIMFYVEWMRTNESRQKQNELLEQQYEIQQTYYQRLHESQEETRALWHDMQKYVSAVQIVQNSSGSPAADPLAKEVQKMVERICPVVDVGNNLVSAILEEYRAQAVQLGIPLKLDILIPPVLDISPIDLYVILGNTLDNAFNACSVLPEQDRWVHVKMRKQNNLLLYQVSNAKSDKIAVHRRGKYHGYGLKNVERSIRRYFGQLSISNLPDRYTISVRMNG